VHGLKNHLKTRN